jgi:methionyl-tRNA formyltransferase
MSPWPGAFTSLRGETLRILAARPLDDALSPRGGSAPGTVLGRAGAGFAVRCGDGGALLVLEAQRPGRRAVSALDFWNGERVEPGETCDGASGSNVESAGATGASAIP